MSTSSLLGDRRSSGWSQAPPHSSVMHSKAAQTGVPPELDLHYITDHLLATSRPEATDSPTYNDKGRNSLHGEKNDGDLIAVPELEGPTTTAPVTDRAVTHPQSTVRPPATSARSVHHEHAESDYPPSRSPPIRKSASSPSLGFLRSPHSNNNNSRSSSSISPRRSRPYSHASSLHRHSVQALGEYLQGCHVNYMIFWLGEEPLDDVTKRALCRQIISLPWSCAGRIASEVPTLGTLIQICQALHAWMESPLQPVAVVSCCNGHTRTALALASYLKWTNQVQSTKDGFCHVLAARQMPEPEAILQQLPASLHTLFANWDKVVDLRHYRQRRPLLLRAICVQGLPLADKPCLEVWDAKGRHLYSSHAHAWAADQPSLPSPPTPVPSHWSEDAGFYKVNRKVEGDFCLFCRFGGTYALDTQDATKILFRYAHHTGYLPGTSPEELPAPRVDWMRPYAALRNNPDFLLTLVWDAHWSMDEDEEDAEMMEELRQTCSDDVLHPIETGIAGQEEGWHLLANHHAAQPNAMDIEHFMQEYHVELRDCPIHLTALALQLTNFDWLEAKSLLLGPLFDWWHPNSDEEVNEAFSDVDPEVERRVEAATHNLASILGSIDIGSMMDSCDWKAGSLLDEATMRLANEKFEVLGQSYANLPQEDRRGPDDAFVYQSPIMSMHPGDIRDALDPYYCRRKYTRPPDATGPMVPIQPRRFIDRSSERPYVAIDDPKNADVVDLLLRMDRPDVTVDDLLNLLEAAETWNTEKPQKDASPEKSFDSHLGDAGDGKVETTTSTEADDARKLIMKNDPRFEKYWKMKSVGLPEDAILHAMRRDDVDETIWDLDWDQSLEQQRPSTIEVSGHPPLKSDPRFEKYWKMKSVGLPDGAILNAMRRDDVDQSIWDLDWEKGLEQQRPLPVEGPEYPSLKTDPRFEKYWKMKSVGLPDGAILNAMRRDNVDQSIWDLDWDKNLEQQRPLPVEVLEYLSLKEDPRFEKYWKMKSVGLPDGAILNAMRRDDVDQSIWDLDWDKSFEQQRPLPAEVLEYPSLKEDPRFEKFWKMKSAGLPDGAIKHAMRRDDVDESILDLDWEKTLESQRQNVPTNEVPEHLPLKEDPRFEKYWKMKSVGLPDGAIKNAMRRDDIDESIWHLDWDQSLESQQPIVSTNENPVHPPLKSDPRFEKYWKMKTVGLSDGAILNAMRRDDVDEKIWSLHWDESLMSQQPSIAPQISAIAEIAEIPLKDDPEFKKYWNMKSVGLPDGAIKNAMRRDGVDETIYDLDRDKSLVSQRPEVAVRASGGCEISESPVKVGIEPIKVACAVEIDSVWEAGVPLKDDPEYSKYFKMLDMGLPRNVCINAMVRDAKDPRVIDLDPSKSVESQHAASPSSQLLHLPAQKKTRVRRKKIFWNPIEKAQEFEELFTESVDPADRNRMKKQAEASKQKKNQQVIDGKRSMNGGIILLRLKLGYDKIARMVDNMEHGQLDSTQLKALKEFLPSEEEAKGLMAYMTNAGEDKEAHTLAYAEFSECEKYMYDMMDVAGASAKFDCMLFRAQFRSRFDDLMKALDLVDRASDEVKLSARLREIFAMILALVNTINTGGDGGGAAGFNLDALLKLNEAKAFDKKTSVLNYLVRLVRQNDESLLDFCGDLEHVGDAEVVILETVCADIKALSDELVDVHKTVQDEADRLSEFGLLKQPSVEDLREQRTNVKNIMNVPQFNQVEHLTGRTSMERFTLSAASSIGQALLKSHEVKEKFIKLLHFFGEDEGMGSNEFFGTMKRFIHDFNTAVEQVEVAEKAKQKEARIAASRSPRASERSGFRPDKKGMADLASLAAKKADARQERVGLHRVSVDSSGSGRAHRKESESPPVAKTSAEENGNATDSLRDNPKAEIRGDSAILKPPKRAQGTAFNGGKQSVEVQSTTLNALSFAEAAAVEAKKRNAKRVDKTPSSEDASDLLESAYLEKAGRIEASAFAMVAHDVVPIDAANEAEKRHGERSPEFEPIADVLLKEPTHAANPDINKPQETAPVDKTSNFASVGAAVDQLRLEKANSAKSKAGEASKMSTNKAWLCMVKDSVSEAKKRSSTTQSVGKKA